MSYHATDGQQILLVDEDTEGRATFQSLGPAGEHSCFCNADGSLQSLGLVDLQVNGFAGVDFNAGSFSSGQIETALNSILATGTTTILPTIITASREDLFKRFLALEKELNASKLGGVMAYGYHLEGPFLSPIEGYSGMHTPELMTKPDYRLVEELEAELDRPILLITVAAELDGAPEFISEATAKGKLVAIGHSCVTPEALEAAIKAGAVMSTHLGNGLPQELPRLDSALWRQLGDDRLMASFIPDGLHIPATTLKCMLRAKELCRSILVTDAATPTGAPAGHYEFAGIPIEATPFGTVCRPGKPGLAGSGLKLDVGLRNLVRWEIATRLEAIRMACANPFRLLTKALEAHRIKPFATSVLWDEGLHPIAVKASNQSLSL